MVQGQADLRAQLERVPQYVQEEVRAAIAKMCDQVVREMKAIAPLPEIAAAIGWTWGEVPAGALKIGSFGAKKYGRISATIYASAITDDFPGGFPAIAQWFEFGTAPRFHKSGKPTGQITAQPFFWPVLRANKRLWPGRVRGAVNRGLKRASQAR